IGYINKDVIISEGETNEYIAPIIDKKIKLAEVVNKNSIINVWGSHFYESIYDRGIFKSDFLDVYNPTRKYLVEHSYFDNINGTYGVIFNIENMVNSKINEKEYKYYYSIYNNTFSNTYGYRGGVVYSEDERIKDYFDFISNTFQNNYAEDGGGIVYSLNKESQPKFLDNNIILPSTIENNDNKFATNPTKIIMSSNTTNITLLSGETIKENINNKIECNFI
ncbi:hypothetical protein PIROE2DRAFT_12130, partial [Piromyces sp. E2]